MYTAKQLNAMKKAELVELFLNAQIEMDALQHGISNKQAAAPRTSDGFRFVGNLVKGVPTFPQVERFAKEHGVKVTAVIVKNERMMIR